jgi:hypothetical protein
LVIGDVISVNHKEKYMSKLSTFVLATAVVLGTTAMVANSKHTINATSSVDARLDSDGAFRDGLYLGKLAAESGQPLSPSVGRWSTDQDRATFSEGYRRGYNESLAHTQP